MKANRVPDDARRYEYPVNLRNNHENHGNPEWVGEVIELNEGDDHRRDVTDNVAHIGNDPDKG